MIATVPPGGLAAWDAPDPSRPSTAALAEGLPLDVLQRVGDWAEVRAENGWTGWVDARQLATAVVDTTTTTTSPLVLAGLAVALVGAFLPWVSFGSLDESAWGVPVRFLLGMEDDTGGIRVGPVLLLTLLALLPAVRAPRPTAWLPLVLVAAVPSNLALLTFVRVVTMEDNGGIMPTVGIGVVLTLAGGALLGGEAWRRAVRV